MDPVWLADFWAGVIAFHRARRSAPPRPAAGSASVPRSRWRDHPRLLVLPLLGAVAIIGLWLGVRWRRDNMPFSMAMLVVACAFATLGASFWPYMIPYSVTVQQAAAPPQSLEFLFWGAGIVLAYVLDPLANRLERLGLNRLIATLVILGLFIIDIGS